MAQVSASSAQEAAVAEVADTAGLNLYPIMLPTGMDSMDEVLLGAFWEVLRRTALVGEEAFPTGKGRLCKKTRSRKKTTLQKIRFGLFQEKMGMTHEVADPKSFDFI